MRNSPQDEVSRAQAPKDPKEMTWLIGHRCKCSNVLSQVVLIGREAYPFKFLNTDLIFSYRLTLSFFHFIFDTDLVQ